MIPVFVKKAGRVKAAGYVDTVDVATRDVAPPTIGERPTRRIGNGVQVRFRRLGGKHRT